MSHVGYVFTDEQFKLRKSLEEYLFSKLVDKFSVATLEDITEHILTALTESYENGMGYERYCQTHPPKEIKLTDIYDPNYKLKWL